MDQKAIAAAYSKIIRDNQWTTIADAKDFDSSQTSIVRVFRHASGQMAIWASKSVDGKTSTQALVTVLHSPDVAVRAVAAEVGCSLTAAVSASAQLAAA